MDRFVLQFNVDVSDTRQPKKTVTASVRINVTPLRGPPRFSKAFYDVNTAITTAVNTSVEFISAVDDDLEVWSLLFHFSIDRQGTENLKGTIKILTDKC